MEKEGESGGESSLLNAQPSAFHPSQPQVISPLQTSAQPFTFQPNLTLGKKPLCHHPHPG